MSSTRASEPDISVIIVVHNMTREAPRTLYSLSAAYQRDIAPDDYEVIVVDNGSHPLFDLKVLEESLRQFSIDPSESGIAVACTGNQRGVGGRPRRRDRRDD